MEISQNFVAISEYMNFMQKFLRKSFYTKVFTKKFLRKSFYAKVLFLDLWTLFSVYAVAYLARVPRVQWHP